MGNLIVSFFNTYCIGSVKNFNTLFKQKLFYKHRKNLRIISTHKSLIFFCSGADSVKPVFRVSFFPAVRYRKAEKLLCYTKGNLMTVSITQRQKNCNNTCCAETAKHKLSFKKNSLLSLSCRSKCSRNSCKSTAAYCYVKTVNYFSFNTLV